VYRTIDKIYILQKYWMNKREQRIQQKGSLKHLKRSAPEVKCSWRQSTPGVMTSSEAISSEATFHQKLKFIRIHRIWSFKSCLLDRNSSYIGRRLVELCNGHFKRIWSHLVAKIKEALTKVLCTNCTTTFSTTLFCVSTTRQGKQLWNTTTPANMLLHNWNGFEIDPS